MRQPLDNDIFENDLRTVYPICPIDDEDYMHCKQLQVSKVQDILRQKITKRPDREYLIQHHILKDTHVAPSLQVYEQSLKKARLADNLNCKLLQRPGPLELVEYNILETDPLVKEVLRDGLIQYEKTSSPYVCSDDDADELFGNYNFRSDKDELLNEHSDLFALWPNLNSTEDDRIFNTTQLSQNRYHDDACPSLYSSQSNLNGSEWLNTWIADNNELYKSSSTSGANALLKLNNHESNYTKKRRNGCRETVNNSASSKGGRCTYRSKPLIFHEYNGPDKANKPFCFPNGFNLSNINSRAVFDTYKILLHQQKIFLHLVQNLQLSADVTANLVKEQQRIHDQRLHDAAQCSDPNREGIACSKAWSTTGKDLEDMDEYRTFIALNQLRVSDLRDHCRRRGLVVGGTKQELIRRISRHDKYNRAKHENSLTSEELSHGKNNSKYDFAINHCQKDTLISEDSAKQLDHSGDCLQIFSNNIQNMNFAELFAAIDAASSSTDKWNFDNVVSNGLKVSVYNG